MVRKGIGFLGLLIALAAQPAEARDRNSSSQVETKALLVAPAMDSVPAPNQRSHSSSGSFFETGYSRSRPSTEQDKDAQEHKPLTLFRFNSKFGEVAVRPVIGKVNGAQFSLEF